MSHAYPQRILVAVDFGDASASAVRLAGSLARRFGAALFAVHAETVEMPPYFTAAQVARLEAERQEAHANAEHAVRALVSQQTPAPAEVLVVEGAPADVILGMAPNFDVVVVGTHGRRGMSRWWLGSVAEAVVRSSPVPVLVTHAMTPEATAVFESGRPRLLIADPVPGSQRPWVASLASAMEVEVVPVPDLSTCSRDLFERGDLLLVSGGQAALAGRVASRLAACPRPVLVVPEPVESSLGRMS